MLVLRQSGCIEAQWLYSGKTRFILAKLMYLGKSGCNRAKVVVFVQKLLYSGKSGGIWAKWLYSGKVVKFGQNMLYSGKSGCIWE